ncbi:hypothetical protein Back2_00380 [Nocardioides baekrokdamisoli]|uniref:Glycosyltransferase RgtA/B/C/D-like domain-containing protein n=1 Tax=Nocardioides baekrokdamisoli TaxID=1804624 RepID=A0A3G9IQ63_9ACTN|nr:hypothetical protein Back2_00380 [Nocardioides baekrokdamisoli]
MVIGHCVVALDVAVPVVRPVIGLVVLMGVPMWAVAGALRGPEATARWLYALGLAVLGSMVLGLAMNELLPLVGIDDPLRAHWLAVPSTVIDVGLLIWRRDAVRWRVRRPRLDGLTALALLGLVLAVVGAIRLNNGADSAVAVCALALAGAALGGLFLRTRSDTPRDARVLYLVSLTLLLATSLRGWYTTGHDIQKEYLVFQLTFDPGRWQMSNFPDPYNACLSLNVLPTVFADFTGISGPLLAKTVPQLIFAALPVVLFLLSVRLVRRSAALLGTLVTITFPTFAVDMPYMVRQEVAFLFLALLFLAGTETACSVRWSRRAVTLAVLGVVLSHYSTSYLMVITLGMGWALWHALRMLLRRLGQDPPEDPPRMLSFGPFAVAAVAVMVWVGPLTHTGGHLGTVLGDAAGGLVGSSSTSVSSDLAATIIPIATEAPQTRLDHYSKTQLELAQPERAAGELLPVTHAQAYPRMAPNVTRSSTPVGRALDAMAVPAATVNGIFQSIFGKAIQLALLLGLLIVLKDRGTRGWFTIEYQVLSLATFVALALATVVPGLSVEYGIYRAFQQALFVLAPVVAVGCWAIFRRLGPAVRPLLVAGYIAYFSTMTGVLGATLGVGLPQIHLDNTGDYFTTYYGTDQDAVAARWTAAQYPSTVVVGEYAGSRLMQFLPGVTLDRDRLYPGRVPRTGWIFLDSDIVDHGISVSSVAGGDRATYVYPAELVRAHRNLVYSNGSDEVYR